MDSYAPVLNACNIHGDANPASASSDCISQLRELNQLLVAGAITKEEFERIKRVAMSGV